MSTVTAPQQRIHPHLFALWLGIAAIMMMFAGLTSAYIVRAGAGDWVNIRFPAIFYVNTVVILASSGTIHWAYTSYKKYRYGQYKLALLLTLMLGCAFTYGQYLGWLRLADIGVYLVGGGAAGSFVILLAFLHLLHIGGGLVAILVGLLRSLLKPFNPNRLIRVQMVATYWHFVDVLWIFLFLFFHLKFS